MELTYVLGWAGGLLGQAGGGGAGGQGQPPSGMIFMVGIMLFMGIFFFLTARSSKKEKQKKADLLNNLKKNDRVLTIGGILGTVVSVKDNEVVLKVDEATNTRKTFLKRSIQQVVTGTEELQLQER